MLFPRTSSSALLLTAVLLLAVGGCNRGPELVPVEGTVTLDGKPLEKAGVLFRPTTATPPAAGETDADGHFSLRTVNAPGAILGEYQVSISKYRQNVTEDGNINPDVPPIVWLIPEKYSKPETSGLKANVTKKENTFTFELSSH